MPPSRPTRRSRAYQSVKNYGDHVQINPIAGDLFGGIHFDARTVLESAQAKTSESTEDLSCWSFPHLPHPALELQVREERNSGQLALRLSVVAVDATGETERRRFEPLALKGDPQRLVEQWWKRLGGPGRSEAKARELADLGALLGQELLPRELARLLLDHVGAERALWLISEEPWLPWELVRLAASHGGERRCLPFLCETFALTRWLGQREPVLRLPCRKIGVLVPEKGGAIAAGDELAMLRSLLGPGRELVLIEPRLETLAAHLEGGELHGLHFCGHGFPPDGDPNLAGIPLKDHQLLTPQFLSAHLGRFAERRPLVFLNGCHTGRGGYGLTGIGGWAAQFLEAGAGAFVGCAWAVNGPTALKVAETFYRELFAGRPLGAALQRARLQEGLTCPLTPWAYVAYGHPLAVVESSSP